GSLCVADPGVSGCVPVSGRVVRQGPRGAWPGRARRGVRGGRVESRSTVSPRGGASMFGASWALWGPCLLSLAVAVLLGVGVFRYVWRVARADRAYRRRMRGHL